MLKKPAYKRLVLTFDAFGTLFTPREPIGKQYADIARKHGLSGFSNAEIGALFVDAFKGEQTLHPNYGRNVGMKAPEWWSRVIHTTFSPFLPTQFVPKNLVPDLLTRFSTSQGYTLYPDVLPLFRRLRQLKQDLGQQPSSPQLTIGIITNSDGRVPSVLSDFGLEVGSRRHVTATQSHDLSHITSLPAPPEDEDINFVALSYEIGFEKPDREIFEAAKQLAGVDYFSDGRIIGIHVGDEMRKDYDGAQAASWEGVIVDRDKKVDEQKISSVSNLLELEHHISPVSAEEASVMRKEKRLSRWEAQGLITRGF